MKIILLASKKYGERQCLVDDIDFEALNQFKWFVVKRKSTSGFYVATSQYVETSSGRRRKTIQMSRLIMKVDDPEIEVDHIDHNGLNNQRNNLRESTPCQNSCNRRKKKNTSSNYKGVTLNKYNRRYINKNGIIKSKLHIKWLASITVNKKRTFIGRFSDEIEAAKAYDKKAKELHGEFAVLNFH